MELTDATRVGADEVGSGAAGPRFARQSVSVERARDVHQLARVDGPRRAKNGCKRLPHAVFMGGLPPIVAAPRVGIEFELCVLQSLARHGCHVPLIVRQHLATRVRPLRSRTCSLAHTRQLAVLTFTASGTFVSMIDCKLKHLSLGKRHSGTCRPSSRVRYTDFEYAFSDSGPASNTRKSAAPGIRVFQKHAYPAALSMPVPWHSPDVISAWVPES